jgi:hypothetical protein
MEDFLYKEGPFKAKNVIVNSSYYLNFTSGLFPSCYYDHNYTQ